MDILKKVRIETYLRQSVLNDVVELEKRVWKKEGYREVNAPMLYFELAYLTNGLVITVFDEGIFPPEEKKMMAEKDPWYSGDHPIGFLACFANFDDEGPFWYGARMGVDRLYQDKNIGVAILDGVYSSAKERKISRIRWTYDPLVSRNAYLYLHRMGAQVQEIGFNYYSAVFTNDELNRDISTDRFIVDWYVNSERVTERMEKHNFPRHDLSVITPGNTLNEIVLDEEGLERPGDTFVLDAESTPLFIEIPYSQDKLLKADRAKAQELREKCRALFMRYLAAGYVIRELYVKKESSGRTRPFYRLDLDPRYA
ncbi:MAG: GNAT family N-acetyltransferase [Deltaproteobacteria bacterium]|nr:GNAT family N-acetyltransferase [Deltaproteobacteria bacterium]MBN2687807.1 GNAT family N-acetyltransferase [Deltaproteobacteria bacterium]